MDTAADTRHSLISLTRRVRYNTGDMDGDWRLFTVVVCQRRYDNVASYHYNQYLEDVS